MRLHLLVAIATLVSPPTVAAEVAVDLGAADPVAGLPVVSANKQNFLRAYRRWRPKCAKPDIFVEDGGIEPTVDEPQYSFAQLVGGCGEAGDAFAGNVNGVNESMRSTQCKTAALRGQVTAVLPATFQAAGMRIDVTGAPASAHVTINRFTTTAWTGGRRMTLPATPFEVRGWYVVELKALRQVAVLLATKESDGTITERWMEIWAKKPAKPVPLDTARTWLLALAAGDATVLAKTSALPFERVGLEPKTGDHAAACAQTRTAKKTAELAKVLDCALAEGPRYVALYDEQELAKIDPRKLPAELAAHATLLDSLAKAGHALVLFANDDAQGSVTIAFAIKNGKVSAVVEVTAKR